MSCAETGFLTTRMAFPVGTPITRAEKLVLYVLACDLGEDSEAWVSIDQLAEETLQGPRQVVRIMERLARKGLLQLIPDTQASDKPLFPATARRTHGGATGSHGQAGDRDAWGNCGRNC